MAATRCNDVFRMRLQLDEFMPVESLWTLRMYEGAPQVTIERTADAIATSALPANVLRQELMYEHVCECHVQNIQPGDDPSVPHTYTCIAIVAKCNAHGNTWSISFSLVLSPRDGISGTYHDPAEDEDEDEDGNGVIIHTLPAATWWEAAVEPTLLSLAPLTRGRYTLGGVISDDAIVGMLIPSVMHLELLPEGRVIGKSEERNDEYGPEMVELFGSWTRSSMEVVKVYELEDGARDVYLYLGSITQFGYRGYWVNVGDGQDARNAPVVAAQRFDLYVRKMQRRWSREEHGFFPEAFRTIVRLCLLSSLRSQATSLPNVLWLHVFEFCDSNWFT